MSLVPDFLSLTHGATKPKLKSSQKIRVLNKLRNFWAILLCVNTLDRKYFFGFIFTLRLDFDHQIAYFGHCWGEKKESMTARKKFSLVLTGDHGIWLSRNWWI